MFAAESQSYEETFKQIGIFIAGVGTFASAFSAFWQSRQAKIGVHENTATALRLETKIDKFNPSTEGRDSMMLALEKSLPRIRQEMEQMADDRINEIKAQAQIRISELEAEIDKLRAQANKPSAHEAST